jgi:hypothetical protein
VAADGERTAQGLAFNQFQYQAIHIAEFFQAVDGRDIGVIQRTRRARLAEGSEPTAPGRARSAGRVLMATVERQRCAASPRFGAPRQGLGESASAST